MARIPEFQVAQDEVHDLVAGAEGYRRFRALGRQGVQPRTFPAGHDEGEGADLSHLGRLIR